MVYLLIIASVGTSIQLRVKAKGQGGRLTRTKAILIPTTAVILSCFLFKVIQLFTKQSWLEQGCPVLLTISHVISLVYMHVGCQPFIIISNLQIILYLLKEVRVCSVLHLYL